MSYHYEAGKFRYEPDDSGLGDDDTCETCRYYEGTHYEGICTCDREFTCETAGYEPACDDWEAQ